MQIEFTINVKARVDEVPIFDLLTSIRAVGEEARGNVLDVGTHLEVPVSRLPTFVRSRASDWEQWE